jgi:hypothetical protein
LDFAARKRNIFSRPGFATIQVGTNFTTKRSSYETSTPPPPVFFR